MQQHFILSVSIRTAKLWTETTGLDQLFVQNFLQFVDTVQLFIFAAFRAQEYSAVEKIFSWTGNANISI